MKQGVVMIDRADANDIALAVPRFVQHPQLLIAGLPLRQLTDPRSGSGDIELWLPVRNRPR
jgi:hypothetical protein